MSIPVELYMIEKTCVVGYTEMSAAYCQVVMVGQRSSQQQ